MARMIARPESITMAETYIQTENYRRAVDAIAIMTGIGPDEIKIALGEHGNVWPESIREADQFPVRSN